MRHHPLNGDCKYFACPNVVILKLQMARDNPGRAEKVSCGCLLVWQSRARFDLNQQPPSAFLGRFFSALSGRLTADSVPTLASTAAVGRSTSGTGSRVAQWLSSALTASCFWRRRDCRCCLVDPRRPHSTTVPSRSLVAASRAKSCLSERCANLPPPAHYVYVHFATAAHLAVPASLFISSSTTPLLPQCFLRPSFVNSILPVFVLVYSRQVLNCCNANVYLLNLLPPVMRSVLIQIDIRNLIRQLLLRANRFTLVFFANHSNRPICRQSMRVFDS